MAKKLTKAFFRANRINTPSAMCIAYAIITGEVSFDLDKLMAEATSEQMATVNTILGETEPSVLITWMRRSMPGVARLQLRKRLLENEAALQEEIKERLLTSLNDGFIETAKDFFVYGAENYTDWILEHYREIRSPYAQASMCLVLGFRADESVVPFLLEQYDEMKASFYAEELWHGPVLALEQLDERFHLV